MPTLPTTPPDIAQEISDIPLLIHRNTVSTPAEQDAFVIAYEATNDALSNDTVPEINTQKDEQNTLADWMEDTATEVYDNAIEGAASAAIAVATANNKGNWSALTGALNIPASVNHNGSVWVLNVNLADVTLSEPSGANSDWTDISIDEADLALKRDIADSYSQSEIDDALALKVNTTTLDENAKQWDKQSTPIAPDADTDYTLTASENLFGRLVLVDGSWTEAHSIIVDDSERDIIVDNSAGTYTPTVKTAAGTGIAVAPGTKAWLLCDGTNIIESVDIGIAETRLNTEDEDYAGQAAGIEILNSNAGEYIKNQCSAWITFISGAVPTIEDSFNVASLVRTATGKYTINFSANMDNVNYAVSGISDSDNAVTFDSVVPPALGSLNIFSRDMSTSVPEDSGRITVLIFGGRD